jgi:hypothetical protein
VTSHKNNIPEEHKKIPPRKFRVFKKMKIPTNTAIKAVGICE